MRNYDPAPLIAVMEGLLVERNESYREASLRSGLDHGAVRRYMRDNKRPSRGSLLVLSDHFGLNPNDLLTLAGYRPMKMFERDAVDLAGLTPDVRQLTDDLERIGDPVLRRRLTEALRLLIAGYLEEKEPDRSDASGS